MQQQQPQQQHKLQSNWITSPVPQQPQDRFRSMPSTSATAMVGHSYFPSQQQQSMKMQGYAPQSNPAYAFSRVDENVSPQMQPAMMQQQQPRFCPPGGAPHALSGGGGSMPSYSSQMEMVGVGPVSRLGAPMQMRSNVAPTPSSMLTVGGVGGQVRQLSNVSISQQPPHSRTAFPPQPSAMLSQLLGPGQMGATPSPSNTGGLSQTQSQSAPSGLVMRPDFLSPSQQPPPSSAMMH